MPPVFIPHLDEQLRSRIHWKQDRITNANSCPISRPGPGAHLNYTWTLISHP
jgi:hypothetical protein